MLETVATLLCIYLAWLVVHSVAVWLSQFALSHGGELHEIGPFHATFNVDMSHTWTRVRVNLFTHQKETLI